MRVYWFAFRFLCLCCFCCWCGIGTGSGFWKRCRLDLCCLCFYVVMLGLGVDYVWSLLGMGFVLWVSGNGWVCLIEMRNAIT